jgi:hypothetical protein
VRKTLRIRRLYLIDSSAYSEGKAGVRKTSVFRTVDQSGGSEFDGDAFARAFVDADRQFKPAGLCCLLGMSV